jgi:6-phosphogluconolactonase
MRSFCLFLVLGSASLALAHGALAAEPDALNAQTMRVYVGTYTDGKSEGIYVLDLDLSSGALGAPKLAAKETNPSFLAIHPDHRFLYAVSEVNNFGGRKTGAVSAFRIHEADGTLTRFDQESSDGAGPCYIALDHEGKYLLVANYGGGTVAVYPLGPGGEMGPACSVIQHKGSGANPSRQVAPHAHSINLDSANKFAVAADLGLDKLLVYRFHGLTGTLVPSDPPFTAVAPGSGPRHFAFHPDGHHAYVINERTSTVTAFDYDSELGVLKELQTLSTLPEGFTGRNSTAEIQVHPSGRFVYGSNRGHNSIAMFAVQESTGKLRPLGHQPTQGKTPRNFALDPTGTFLLAENQDSDTIVVFRIDPKTGLLDPTGHTASVPKPVCVKMMPKSP